MAKALYEYLDEEDGTMRKRFIEGAFQEANADAEKERIDEGNKRGISKDEIPLKNKIKSLNDLEYYLGKYLGTPNGDKAWQNLDNKSLQILFESKEFRKELGELDGDRTFEIVPESEIKNHHVEKGFQIIEIKKEVKVNNYIDKSGSITVGHSRSKPRKFNDKELNYLLPRLKDNPKSLVADFNKRFHDFPRTDVSILTKVGRIKRSNKSSFKK